LTLPAPPLRIAFCITDLDPGGAERAFVQLVTRLDRRFWEPAVFCLSSGGILTGELKNARVPVVSLGARRWSGLAAIWRLARELRRFRPVILQTFLFHANLAGRIAGRVAGVRHIVSGIRVAEKRSRVPLWLDRWTGRLVERNVCVSQAVAEFSISAAGLTAEKIMVIPNGVDVSKFAGAVTADLAGLGIPPGSRVLLSIGRLDPQKGVRDVVAAAALVVPRLSDVHFLLVGEGRERHDLERLILEHGLAERVHLAGWRADIPELLAAGVALVLASHWEGLPNVILEAMAAGLAVVATRVEGTAELVIEGQTGLLVPPQSPRELAAAIEKLLADPAAAKAMGHAGQERAKAEFSWERMVTRYENLYQSLLEQQTGSAPRG
jgi:glycosyltransferase involved in cell wall biosynthesis